MAEFATVLASDQLSVTPSYQAPLEISEFTLDNLMEKLRNKAVKDPKHGKSWGEMTKALRIAITDKRNIVDSMERINLQKVLDTLQKSIKVTSLQSMLERLDSITRQQGLKLVRQSNTECYITSDMFYVEILLEHSGEVNDVKIAHDKPVSCPELTKVLRSGNFTEFTKHLEGLSAIYQLNTENSGQLDCEAQKKLKKKAYSALYHLESDLSQLWKLQRSIKDPSNLVHKSPVGILQERQGGYSLKLTYFISPYDLLDMKTKSSITLTVDAVVEKSLGHSVTVCIEGSTSHKLQSGPLITVPENGEKSLPSFAAHTPFNSTTLPASFTLKLQEPIPIAVSILKKIEGVTKISNFADICNSKSLLSVVIYNTSKGKIQNSSHKNLYVTLPDQHHCYNMKANQDLQGVLVSSIPFTHPTHVPQILDFLRQQMLFNTVISSCIRPESKKDLDSSLRFDIHAYSTNHIQVTFVHPLDESLAAVDLDLKEITNVKCKIHTLGMDHSLCSDEYASKVMQRCLSIPITMRAVIRKAQGQQQQKKHERSDLYSATVGGRNDGSYIPHMSNYGNSLSNGSSLSSGPFTSLASGMCNKAMDAGDLKTLSTEDTGPYNLHDTMSSESSLSDHRNIPPGSKSMDVSDDKSLLDCKSPSLSTQSVQSKPANTMLLSMLNDVPSATPSSIPFSLGSKPRKRKATSDSKSQSSVGKSPKRKMSEDECMREQLISDVHSPSFSVDKCNSLPASLPSTVVGSPQPSRTTSSVDPYTKSELQSYNYPQRSSSTDSYLSFRSNQMNMNESSNPELISQTKIRSHFPLDTQRVDDNEGPLILTTGQNAMLDKASEKISKKVKKSKDTYDIKSELHENVILKSHNQDSSESSTSSDFFQKSGIEFEIKHADEQALGLKTAHFGSSSHTNVGGTSLKISKTGDGHKVSKSEMKIKQKDGRRSTSDGALSKKKSEGKKDRKRRLGDVTSNRVHQIHSDSSLMPPPGSAVDISLVSSMSDNQSKRPITLTVKDSPPSGSTHTKLQSSNTSASSSTHPSKSTLSKSTSDKSAVKASRSSHSIPNSKSSNPDHDGDLSPVAKVTINNPLKLQSKLKQSSSNKSTGGSLHSGSQSSPSKPKSALKLKNAGLSHLHLTSSVNPVISKSSQMHSSGASIAVVTALVEEPTSPTSKQSGSKSQAKSQIRSGKGSLSAVIDKLRVSATHAQLPDNFKPNSCGSRSDLASESKPERKEGVKDCSTAKGNESKNKKCSDQFTVKQSSQGIKLTVTKTKPSDGSLKHGKPKTLSSKNVSSGGAQSANRIKSPGTHLPKKTGSVSPSSKKAHPPTGMSPNSLTKTLPSSLSSSNPSKSGVTTGSKVSNSGTSYQKIPSSTGTSVKPKISPGLQPSKKKLSSSSDPKNISSHLDNLEKSCLSSNESGKLTAPAPPARLTRLDSSWQLSNVAGRSEEDLDRERTFRLLLEQSKNEGQNGSEQNVPVTKPSDFSIKALSAIKPETDNKEFLVSSSTDAKRPQNFLRHNQEHVSMLDQGISRISETKTTSIQRDVLPSKKPESALNVSLVSSSEMNKMPAFGKIQKLNECTDIRNEDDSSPEDGLVIDNPGTPHSLLEQKQVFQNKREKSPDLKKRVEPPVVDDRPEKYDFSQGSFIAKTSDQLFIPTTNHSPLARELSSVDDELLNMALTMGK